MLIIEKNSIFKKLLNIFEEGFASGCSGSPLSGSFLMLSRICLRHFCLAKALIKFLDSFLKFKSLVIANVHGRLEFVNLFTQIVSLGENRFRSFPIKGNT